VADGSSAEPLIQAALAQWEQYPHEKLTRAHALLHEINRCILHNGGCNQYNVQHTHITQRQNQGADPVDRAVSWIDGITGVEAHDRLLNGAPVQYEAEAEFEDKA
jgi:hypothetical protein